MNILFLNVGRRCELVESFREALKKRTGGNIFGSDIDPLAPGLQVVDYARLFPSGDSKEFPKFLLDFCKKELIDLVIPTIDPDLIRLDRIRNLFNLELPECRLLLSPSFTIKYSRDKRLSKLLFTKLGVDVPMAINPQDPDLKYPVFVKPFDGSSGIGACVVHSKEYLFEKLKQEPNLMIEQIVEGPEYTVDVLCDFSGKALIAVPRKRIKVRGGEVVQSVVERNKKLENLSMKIAEGFKATGPVTIQFRSADACSFVAMEINARVGGGLPLAIASGADFPGWILDLCLGKEVNTDIPIVDGLVMTRCDRSFFLKIEQITMLQGHTGAPIKKII